MTELRKELIEWITAYKDVAERHALAETPEESADYLLSLEPLAALLKLYEQTAETCPKCDGYGWTISKATCSTCSGTGKFYHLKGWWYWMKTRAYQKQKASENLWRKDRVNSSGYWQISVALKEMPNTKC